LCRAGVLIEGVILKGSGALDEEAAAMMRRASSFPKAPGDVPGERIEFVRRSNLCFPPDDCGKGRKRLQTGAFLRSTFPQTP
jgi:hypothetical protein